MSKVCKNISELKNKSSISSVEKLYGIKFPKEMIEFFLENNGGTPINKLFTADGKEYELRCFLSFNEDEYNSIHKAIQSYQTETKGKIAPVAKDSGDNYFCINIDTGNIYYNDNSDGLYYKLFDKFSDLVKVLN